MPNELSNEDLRNELLARMEAMETNILTTVLARIEQGEQNMEKKLRTEFSKLSQPLVSRLRANEVGLIGSNERLDAIEYRVSNLELR